MIHFIDGGQSRLLCWKWPPGVNARMAYAVKLVRSISSPSTRTCCASLRPSMRDRSRRVAGSPRLHRPLERRSRTQGPPLQPSRACLLGSAAAHRQFALNCQRRRRAVRGRGRGHNDIDPTFEIERITGTPPHTFASFLSDHRADFTQSVATDPSAQLEATVFVGRGSCAAWVRPRRPLVQD